MGGGERTASVESDDAMLERPTVTETPPEEELESREPSLVPPAPPPGLDTVLYEHDERSARSDLRRQIAAMELELAHLVSSAFPRKGIEFRVAGARGPRVLSVDELERVRDSLAARIREVKGQLDGQVAVEARKRELIDEMVCDPGAHRWIRVSNQDIGEPGCKHWHSRPKWGLLGMLAGWWRVKVSSGCPLERGLRPPDGLMATKRQRRKQRRRQASVPGDPPAGPAAAGRSEPSAVARDDGERAPAARERAASRQRPAPPWGSFPLSELVVLIGLILLVAGFFVSGQQGGVMMIVGLALGALGGLELAVREHFAGYKSHTTLLSGAVGLTVLVLLILVSPLHPAVCAGAAVLVFAGSVWLFATAFRRRSGGALFRIRGS